MGVGVDGGLSGYGGRGWGGWVWYDGEKNPRAGALDRPRSGSTYVLLYRTNGHMW